MENNAFSLLLYYTIVYGVKYGEDNGNNGIGHPEPLKENLSGYWSRTIDEKNRLVYKIEDELIKIIQFLNLYQSDILNLKKNR
ncbi:MAG: type II toxin-antitoxin system YoeB family toxin [Treponema sp.]|nr:type II toxin-antitoxin system YoeB family toxin [Treponema sp.]